jgi:hypothetical protein
MDRKELPHEPWCDFRKGDDCVCGTDFGSCPPGCEGCLKKNKPEETDDDV